MSFCKNLFFITIILNLLKFIVSYFGSMFPTVQISFKKYVNNVNNISPYFLFNIFIYPITNIFIYFNYLVFLLFTLFILLKSQ